MSMSSVRSLLICNPRYFTDCAKLISELSIISLGELINHTSFRELLLTSPGVFDFVIPDEVSSSSRKLG